VLFVHQASVTFADNLRQWDEALMGDRDKSGARAHTAEVEMTGYGKEHYHSRRLRDDEEDGFLHPEGCRV
jgi:hypothetical protein